MHAFCLHSEFFLVHMSEAQCCNAHVQGMCVYACTCHSPACFLPQLIELGLLQLYFPPQASYVIVLCLATSSTCASGKAGYAGTKGKSRESLLLLKAISCM